MKPGDSIAIPGEGEFKLGTGTDCRDVCANVCAHTGSFVYFREVEDESR